MASILISYGDNNFKNSLWYIKYRAKKLGIFDSIKTYGPRDLPPYILSSPLMSAKRGGGYWIWKPYLISKTLNELNDGDILFYTDAGCVINLQNNDWYEYIDILKDYNAIFFQYRNEYDYHWDKYKYKSPAIKHWSKDRTLTYFEDYFGSDKFESFSKIWCGSMFIKKSVVSCLIEEWLNISLFHPDLIVDPIGTEKNHQREYFNEHRHDQAILTPLIYKYQEEYNLKVLPEKSESNPNGAAIKAYRMRVGDLNLIETIKFRLNRLLN